MLLSPSPLRTAFRSHPCLCCAQVSLLSVEDMYQNLAPAVKDKYWNESMAQPPHTMATAAETLKPSFLGSTFDVW